VAASAQEEIAWPDVTMRSHATGLLCDTVALLNNTLCLAWLAPLGGSKVHVRVKFLDGRAGSRDTARHPFEGQPHSGSRQHRDMRSRLRRGAVTL